jgi:hypothetical protein
MKPYEIGLLVIGALSWLILLLGYAWTVWRLARGGRDAIPASPSGGSKVVDLDVRRRRGRAKTEAEAPLEHDTSRHDFGSRAHR